MSVPCRAIHGERLINLKKLAGKAAKSLDALTGSESTRQVINRRIADYGTLQSLKLEPAARRIQADLLLKGETVPVRIDVLRYEFKRTAGTGHFVVREIRVDRPWLDALLNHFVVGRPWDIPPEHLEFLDGLIG